MDITALILDDHQEQRRLFALLEQVDRRDTESLASIWHRLATFLEVHADTEEQVFYPELVKVGLRANQRKQTEDETRDAIKDHNEIRDAVGQANGSPVGSAEWFRAVKAANKANSDHMAEEEREGLTDFRELTSAQVRHDLGVRFIALESQHSAGVVAVDKDPDQWVKQAEERS